MLRGRRVALIGFTDEEFASYTALLEQHGAFCRRVDSGVIARALQLLETFDLVLVRVGGDLLPAAIEKVVVETCRRPVLVIGSETSLSAMRRFLSRPSRDYAFEPCSAAELGLRCSTLLPNSPDGVRSQACTVLVADDDRVTLALLETTFVRDGLICRAVSNGEEALAFTKQFGPEVVILDVNMPGLDGFSVLEAIKRDTVTASARVLMLTGSAVEEDVRRARALGADGYIVKPVKPGEIVRRVKTLVGLAA